MATPSTVRGREAPLREETPRLEQGDHLTREEFERRYEAMPELKKAELIEGVVHMPSPVRLNRHGRPQRMLSTWLGVYEAGTPGVRGGDNCSIRLDLNNAPQPDAVLLIDPACGGQARISEDDYIEGSPEWVGEVAASTVSIDLHDKIRVYRRNQVREYVVWRVEDREIDWFALRQSQYERLPRDSASLYRSAVFPGLWLDAAALARFDLATVLQVLQQGLASAEHAAFVDQLQQHTPGPR